MSIVKRSVRDTQDDRLPVPFIVGMPRSGKTMLRLMLDRHPAMAIPSDTHFLAQVLALRGHGASLKRRFCESIVGQFTWKDFGISQEKFRDALEAIDHFSVAEGIRTFYNLYASGFGKQRWGDKTPGYGYLMREIHLVLPEAHFIHVIRDGRDVAADQRGTHLWHFDNLEAHATEWLKRIRQFRRQADSAVPYMEVRFEDMVVNTTSVLRRVCDFVKLSYHPSLEQYYATAGDRIEELQDVDSPRVRASAEDRRALYHLLRSPPDASRVGLYRHHLSRQEIAVYEKVAGELLQELGHDLQREPLCEAPAGNAQNAPVSRGSTAVPGATGAPRTPGPALNGVMNTRVKDVRLTWIKLPFRDIPLRHIVRENPHWQYFELCEVTLECGLQGFGETMVFYTSQRVTERAIQRAIGQRAADLMWDDSLGVGLQQALFDVVGKAMDVPIHSLLGGLCRERVPVAWWTIDMSETDLLAETRTALHAGYTCIKTKARPWFDIRSICKAVGREIPTFASLHLDFNEMLIDAPDAVGIIRELEHSANIGLIEEPVSASDIEGNIHIRSRISTPLAIHVGKLPLEVAVRNEMCDGIVVGRSGVRERLRQSMGAASVGKPVCLQQVGTSITATFCLHVGAVVSSSRWPAVTCHQLFEDHIAQPQVEVVNGLATVPCEPGLGIALDREAVERYRMEPLHAVPYPHPDQLLAIRWPIGSTTYYTHGQQYWGDFLEGRLPRFQPGVCLENIPDDGSPEWRDLYGRARLKAVHTKTAPF